MQIRHNLQPGDLGSIIQLHGKLYFDEYNLDYTFEGHVAVALGEFAKSFDPDKDLFAVAEVDGRIVGSIAIMGLPDKSAQLRFFLLHPDVRGIGLGKRLLNEALDFCRQRRFISVFLLTIGELETAAHLYRTAGFQITEQKTHELWGALRTEQRYEMKL